MPPILVNLCPKCGYTNSAADVKCAQCSAKLPALTGRKETQVARSTRSAGPATQPSGGCLDRLGPFYAGWLIAAFAAAFVVFAAPPVHVECGRELQGGPVDCTVQKRLLWSIALGTRRIEDVRRAEAAKSFDDEGGAVYLVMLMTANGAVPLSGLYTPGSASKQAVADQINDFVNSRRAGKLRATEPGIMSAEELFCMITGLPLFFGFSFGWKVLKAKFKRSRRSDAAKDG